MWRVRQKRKAYCQMLSKIRQLIEVAVLENQVVLFQEFHYRIEPMAFYEILRGSVYRFL
jgi:hypothetical protein